MVKMKVQVALLLLTLSVSGLVAAADAKTPKPSPFCQNVRNAIGTSPDTAIQKLGKPASREDKDMKSTHTEGVVDKVSILKYNGVRLGFLFSGETSSSILLGAEFAAGKFSADLNALVPPSKEAALAKLGKPEEEQDDPNTLRYFCTSDLNEWVDLVYNPTSQLIATLIFTSHID